MGVDRQELSVTVAVGCFALAAYARSRGFSLHDGRVWVPLAAGTFSAAAYFWVPKKAVTSTSKLSTPSHPPIVLSFPIPKDVKADCVSYPELFEDVDPDFAQYQGDKYDPNIAMIAALNDRAKWAVTEIVPGRLWLGNAEGARPFNHPERLTHLLDCSMDHPKLFDGVEVATISVSMSPKPGDVTLHRAVAQLRAWLQDPEAKILVHCQQGRHRSAATVIGALLWRTGKSYDEVLAAVRQRRPMVHIQHKHRDALVAFEKLMKSNQT